MEYETYMELGFKKLTKDEFNEVVTDAEMRIEETTRHFYDPYFHSIEKDLSSGDKFFNYRATQYQKAIAIQCEFENESGLKTPSDYSTGSIKSVEIGRTTIQQDSNNFSEVLFGSTGIVKIAIGMLENTGLLYRGVDCR